MMVVTVMATAIIPSNPVAPEMTEYPCGRLLGAMFGKSEPGPRPFDTSFAVIHMGCLPDLVLVASHVYTSR